MCCPGVQFAREFPRSIRNAVPPPPFVALIIHGARDRIVYVIFIRMCLKCVSMTCCGVRHQPTKKMKANKQTWCENIQVLLPVNARLRN